MSAEVVTSYPQYPDKELQEIQTANIIVFSLIVAVFIVAVSLLLIILGCLFFSFRRNSCIFSKERKKVRKEVKASDLKDSSALSKSQKTLRFLATSKDDYSKKFELLKYTTFKQQDDQGEDHSKHDDDQLKEEDAAEDASKDTETSGAHDDEVPTELNDQDNAATLPEYTYPKHIISELTQE